MNFTIADIKKNFELPDFRDDDKNRLAGFLHSVLKYVSIIVFIILVVAAIYQRYITLAITLFLFIALASAFIILNKRFLRTANVISLISFLIAAQITTYTGDGINDISMLIYPGIIVISALLLNKKLFYYFTAISVFSIVITPYLRRCTGMENMHQDELVAEIITAVVILLAVAAAIHILFINLIDSYQRLKTDEKKFRDIFNNIQDIFFEMNLKGEIEEISASVKKVLKFKRENLIGESFARICQYNSQFAELIDEIKKNGTVFNFELKAFDKNQGEKFLLMNASVIKDHDQDRLKIVGSLMDITEKKTLENQLNQSQKLESIGRLAGGVAHDFNNYLTVITGHSEIAMNALFSGKGGIEKNLEAIHKAGNRAAALTRQLLAFSRKQVYQLQICDPNAVITDLQKMFGRVIGENIEIKLKLYQNEKILIKADPSQIEQIVMNLLVNASDAIEQKKSVTSEKHITIGTGIKEYNGVSIAGNIGSTPGQFFVISVSDSGIGMNQDIKNKVFDPFFTTKSQGTGLGLSTVYGIVRQNNGFINVYSEEGVGTTFRIYWPLARESEEQKKTEVQMGDFRGDESILLVEDDKQVREYTSLLLKSYGYNVIRAENGYEAHKIFTDKKEEIDLIITDIVMPKMSGIELASKAQKDKPDIEILYVSGYTDNLIDRDGLLKEGINYVQKPFTVHDILSKVRELLDKE